MSGGLSWLRQTLNRLRGRGAAGDVIAANVEEGARGVAVGKNIIQIGSVIFPAWLLAAMVLGAIAVVFAIWLATTPARMDGAFNVAVAEFGTMGEDGRAHASAEGKLLSRWVFDALRQEYALHPEVTQGLALQMWHDSLPFTAKRAQIGFIADEKAARARAEQIGASVLIYGYLDRDHGFKPQFYVAHDLVRGDVDAVSGNYQLGEAVPVPFPIRLDDPGVRGALSVGPSTRARALFWLSVGLTHEVVGESAQALAVFRQAEEQLATTWQERDGKEILYFFIGREALFLSRDFPEAEYLDQAEQAFAEAIRIGQKYHGDYARAHIGLAGVYYERARQAPPELRLETGDLAQAIAEYQAALDLAPPETQVAAIARLGLGIAYRMQAEAHLVNGQDAEAEAGLVQAVDDLKQAVSPLAQADLYRFLAQAYLALGASYHQLAYLRAEQGDRAASLELYRQASDAYGLCIAQGETAAFDRILTQKIVADGCVPYQRQAQAALSELAAGN